MNEIEVAKKKFEIDTIPEDDAEYIKMLGGDKEAVEEASAESDPLLSMGKLRIGKETAEVSIVFNGDTLKTFGKKTPLVLLISHISESRVLWHADNGSDEANVPACSTQNFKLGTFIRGNDKGIGTWRSEIVDIDSKGQMLGCSSCPYNQFGSYESWHGKAGNGKACNEYRLIIGFVAKKSGSFKEGLDFYEPDPDMPPVYIQVPATSIRAVSQIGNICAAKNFGIYAGAFMVEVDNKSNGSIKWGVLKGFTHVGYVDKVNIKSAKATYNLLAIQMLGRLIEPEHEKREKKQIAGPQPDDDRFAPPPDDDSAASVMKGEPVEEAERF